MKFEDYVTLFIDLDKITKSESESKSTIILTEDISDFFEKYNLGNVRYSIDIGERLLSLYVKGRNITIDFILDLEEALDSRITLCSRYIGSAETIHSLGLD